MHTLQKPLFPAILALALTACSLEPDPVAEDPPETTPPDRALGAPLFDLDGDGFAATSDGGRDCDDHDPSVNPTGVEVCDTLDNDCDGQVDEDLPAVEGFQDSDEDGYGDPMTPNVSCLLLDGWVENGLDCDDSTAEIHPGAVETCLDGVDRDCDGLLDELDSECIPPPMEGPSSCDPSLVPADVSFCAEGVAAVLPSGATYSTVDEAMNDALPGDVMTICPGIWPVATTQHASPLSLVGFGASTSVLSGNGSGDSVIEMGYEHALTLMDLGVEGGQGDWGGGLRGSAADLCLDGVAFRGNEALNAGGAIAVEGTGALTVIDSTFFQNESIFGAGAIFAETYTLEINNSTFEENLATFGAGALEIDNPSTGSIIDTVFLHNSTSGSAGALEYGGVGPASTLTLARTTFEGNTSGDEGGAITLGATLIVIQSLFEENQSGYKGGAVRLGTFGTLYGLLSEFRENASVHGGAIYLHGSGTPTAQLERCTFEANEALFGAALYLIVWGNESTVSATASGCTFTSNRSARDQCGAVYLEASPSAQLTSVDSDWGAGTTDNTPDDVCGHWYGDEASFVCTDGACY